MRMNVYQITYPNGHQIRHYLLPEFIKKINQYNTCNRVGHSMNLNKVRRYSGGASLPKEYESFQKIPMREYINVPHKTRLSTLNYRNLFESISAD